MQTIKDVEINALRKIDPNDDELERYMPYTYLMSEDMDKWTQSHDSGRRYKAMTTNIFKCFNGVLKGAHGLPTDAVVEFTWYKFVAYFHDRYKEITFDLSQGKVWSDYAIGIYTKNVRKALGHTMRAFNHETCVYQVLAPYNNHRGGGGNHGHEIHIFARTCDCGKWQNIKIPCLHTIKVFQSLRVDLTSYIDPCYSLDNAIHTYSHQFVVPKSESLWREVSDPRWVPDPNLLQAKSQPVKSRIRNEMDGVWREPGSRREESDLRDFQPRQRCKVCHEEGHYCRRCPNSRRASTSSDVTN